MLTKLLVALVPLALIVFDEILRATRMPPAIAGDITAALDRLLRWLIASATASENVSGLAVVKQSIVGTADAAGHHARERANEAIEHAVYTRYRDLVTDPQVGHQAGLTGVDAAGLRDIPEAAVRSRIRELVAEQNTARDAIATRAGLTGDVVRSTRAGLIDAEAIAAGRTLYADEAAVQQLLAAWPKPETKKEKK